jgi:hypothetical protein
MLTCALFVGIRLDVVDAVEVVVLDVLHQLDGVREPGLAVPTADAFDRATQISVDAQLT